MPELVPFKGVRYNPTKVNLETVVAPPYDVIPPALQTKLYEKDPHNVVRLILAKEKDPYASAAATFAEWEKNLILVRDKEPGMYLVHQTFDGPGGVPVTRKGFVALCRLEEFSANVVLPHEKTHSRPKEDRLNLLKATGANLSQIFCLYSDPEKEVDRILNGWSKTDPLIDVTYEDVQNRLWMITDPKTIADIREAMHAKQVLIADGHHRYETALAYRAERMAADPRHTGSEPYNYVMMFLTNVDDEGLIIYPTHRVIHSLSSFDAGSFLQQVEEHFIVRSFEQEELLLPALESCSVPSFGVVIAGDQRSFLLSLKPVHLPGELVADALPPVVKSLDVTLLHHVILRDILGISLRDQEEKKNIAFVREADEALKAVRTGGAQLAFFMNAAKIEQVRAVAKAGHTMPQKSTYFYPKLLSGLVMNKLSG